MKRLLALLLFPICAFAQQQPQNYIFNPGAATPVQLTPGAQSKQSTDGNGGSYVIILTPVPQAPPQATISWKRLAVPAATVPAAYTPTASGVTGLLNTAPLVGIRLNNQTDQSISCSASGGTSDDYPAIAGHSVEYDDVGANGKVLNTSIVCKATSTPPSTGTFYINAK